MTCCSSCMRGHCSLLWYAGFSLWWSLLLQSTGSRCSGLLVAVRGLSGCGSPACSIAVVHGLCYSKACGVFLDQGSNPCGLPWQNSLPLSHRGSSTSIYSFLSLLQSLWDLVSLTRDWTQGCSCDSAECQPLDHQEIPHPSIYALSSEKKAKTTTTTATYECLLLWFQQGPLPWNLL